MRPPIRLLALAFALTCVPAAAETYPERPIRLIVPFAAGGTVDIVARIVGAKLSEIAGRKVVVDNRGGAGGLIGTEMAVQAPGDGYTLLIHSGSITYDPSLHDKLPYDTMKDLAPVTMIGTTPNLLVVTPSFPARSASDLIRMAREKPGGITYATGGFGSSSHLAVALFCREPSSTTCLTRERGRRWPTSWPATSISRLPPCRVRSSRSGRAACER
jgi:tripartite-type tricarboxylate transporter receptor subunit TctC